MTNKPRKVWVVCLLSLFWPGLGQIYNGQAEKGVVLMAISFISYPIYVLCIDDNLFAWSIAGLFLFSLFYYVTVVTDAVMTARALSHEYVPKVYNNVLVYIGIVLMFTIVSGMVQLYVRDNYVQTFKVPAGSMEPTIAAGDHILVDRRENTRAPDRGDVVVFATTDNPEAVWIKRVVALGGDTVELREGQLIVNGRKVNEPYLAAGASAGKNNSYGPFNVPAVSYFVLGDNRGNSVDSRTFGAVSKERIMGIARRVYFSMDEKKRSIRWDRIGRRIRQEG